MARLKLDHLDISDEAFAILERRREAMPMSEILSFCVNSGAMQLEASYYQERGDALGRIFGDRLAICRHNQAELFADEPAPVVSLMNRPKAKE